MIILPGIVAEELERLFTVGKYGKKKAVSIILSGDVSKKLYGNLISYASENPVNFTRAIFEGYEVKMTPEQKALKLLKETNEARKKNPDNQIYTIKYYNYLEMLNVLRPDLVKEVKQ